MKSKSLTLIGLVCCGVLLVVVGFVSGVLLMTYSEIQINNNLSVGQLLAPLTAFCVSIIVIVFIERKLANSSKAQSLFLDYVGNSLAIVNEIESIGDRFHLDSINPLLKKLKLNVTTSIDISKELSMSPDFLHALEKTKEEIRKLRETVTNTPLAKVEAHADECEVEVKDGIIQLAKEKRALADTTIGNIKASIFRAQMEILKR
ncbi:MAG: hypothetical protein JJU20_14840 [Opitutales bacterium]|nr:hypothetical protein [Opitutales bacterium]